MPIENPIKSCHGAVLVAEQALAAAQSALTEPADLSVALNQSAQALRAAGWYTALRFNEALLMAAPFAVNDISDNACYTLFESALVDFAAALSRRNLHELACSTQLVEHYRALYACANPDSSHFIPFDEFALAGRSIPAALLHTELSSDEIARVRERYERALLDVLRAPAETETTADDALDELSACLASLADTSPYNMWQLASACVSAQRLAGCAYDADTKRLYARYNLLLKEQMQGVEWAPVAVVRASVALLWRAFAVAGAASKQGRYVQLLRNYGLPIDWHIAEVDSGNQDAASYQEGALLLHAIHSDGNKQIGALTVSRSAYEDFLQISNALMLALTRYTKLAIASEQPQAGVALQASELAYRLALLASKIGLARVALLTAMLGLAWRRYAYTAIKFIDAPSPEILERASQVLNEQLEQFAAGYMPDERSADCYTELSAFIESETDPKKER